MSRDSTTLAHRGVGRRRRDAALDALAERRAELIARAEWALLTVLLRHGRATADDVRAALGELPDVDPRWLGTVPRRLCAAGIIRHGGYAHSARAESHARPIAVWKLADRAAALARLDERSAAPPPSVPAPPTGPVAQRLLWEC